MHLILFFSKQKTAYEIRSSDWKLDVFFSYLRFVWISGRGSRRRVLVMAIAPVGQMQTAQAFTWGQGGQRLTPEDIALQRRLAAQQMQQGADFSPIGYWSQGLARVAQGLFGEIGRAHV